MLRGNKTLHVWWRFVRDMKPGRMSQNTRSYNLISRIVARMSWTETTSPLHHQPVFDNSLRFITEADRCPKAPVFKAALNLVSRASEQTPHSHAVAQQTNTTSDHVRTKRILKVGRSRCKLHFALGNVVLHWIKSAAFFVPQSNLTSCEPQRKQSVNSDRAREQTPRRMSVQQSGVWTNVLLPGRHRLCLSEVRSSPTKATQKKERTQQQPPPPPPRLRQLRHRCCFQPSASEELYPCPGQPRSRGRRGGRDEARPPRRHVYLQKPIIILVLNMYMLLQVCEHRTLKVCSHTSLELRLQHSPPPINTKLVRSTVAAGNSR